MRKVRFTRSREEVVPGKRTESGRADDIRTQPQRRAADMAKLVARRRRAGR